MPSRTAPKSPLAKKLQALRRSAGLTQVELAWRSDLSIQTVAGLEQGHRTGSPRTLRKLARALAVPISALLASRP